MKTKEFWRVRLLSCDGGRTRTWREKFFENEEDALQYQKDTIKDSDEKNPDHPYSKTPETVDEITGYCNRQFGLMCSLDKISIDSDKDTRKLRLSKESDLVLILGRGDGECLNIGDLPDFSNAGEVSRLLVKLMDQVRNLGPLTWDKADLVWQKKELDFKIRNLTLNEKE